MSAITMPALKQRAAHSVLAATGAVAKTATRMTSTAGRYTSAARSHTAAVATAAQATKVGGIVVTAVKGVTTAASSPEAALLGMTVLGDERVLRGVAILADRHLRRGGRAVRKVHVAVVDGMDSAVTKTAVGVERVAGEKAAVTYSRVAVYGVRLHERILDVVWDFAASTYSRVRRACTERTTERIATVLQVGALIGWVSRVPGLSILGRIAPYGWRASIRFSLVTIAGAIALTMTAQAAADLAAYARRVADEHDAQTVDVAAQAEEQPETVAPAARGAMFRRAKSRAAARVPYPAAPAADVAEQTDTQTGVLTIDADGTTLVDGEPMDTAALADAVAAAAAAEPEVDPELVEKIVASVPQAGKPRASQGPAVRTRKRR
jgi:hypothetical protein